MTSPFICRRFTYAAACLLSGAVLFAEPVNVRYPEGLVHGFLKLSSLDGTALADGDLIQTARGTRITSRLVFHFKDGSLHDETGVFSQRGQLRLVSYRLTQRGPSFPRPLEMSVSGTGDATVRFTDEHGQSKTEREHIDILSMIVATPKPRLVTLKLQKPYEDRFSTGGIQRKAVHYILKVDIGGVAGLVAPIAGKEPPDQHIWILGGEAPAFVKSEQQLFMDGPLWRIELVSPVWPRSFN
jgi:hypothetical protein